MRKDVSIVKAICTILIIVEHIGCPRIISPIIDAITLIPFAISSGIVFNVQKYSTYKFHEFVYKKYIAIFLPYLLFIIPGLLYSIIRVHTLTNIFTEIMNILLVVNIPINSALWYLGSFFYVNILVFIVFKISTYLKKYYNAIVLFFIFAFALVSYVLSFNHIVNLPFKIESGIIIATFMMMGLLIRPYLDSMINFVLNNKSYGEIIFAIVFVFTCIILYFNTYHSNSVLSMWENHIGNPILYYVGGILITFIYYVFVDFILKVVHNSNIFIYILEDFGKVSLYIYCLHVYAIIISNKVLSLMNMSSYSNSSKVIKSILIPIFLYLLVKYCRTKINN